jgi:SAM-dependent methyltransferase
VNLFARETLQGYFYEALKQNFAFKGRVTIAVVGGSKKEPEISTLKKLGIEFSLCTFGIEDSDTYFDLNIQNFDYSRNHLVICSQVLEHVWDMENAFQNLVNLLLPGGLLWIGCPTSNKKHEGGSVQYFSAGYQPKFIINHLKKLDLEILSYGDFGSERLYKLTHKQLDWPSKKEYITPLTRRISRKRIWGLFRAPNAKEFLGLIKQLYQNMEALAWNKEIVFGSDFSTETYVLAQKRQVKECTEK